MTTQYTVDYFIQKFSKIPNRLWCVGHYENGDKRCASGHCGAMRDSLEWYAFQRLVPNTWRNGWPSVNDGNNPNYPQPTPKARILAALKDVKEWAK